MGTYTTNYNLFMPSIGEQGWGELVNGNFTTIDATMGGLNTHMGTAESNITSLTSRMGTSETIITSNTSRIGTLETDTNAMKEKLDAIEVTDGVLEGKYAGEFTGNVKGRVYVNGEIVTTGKGDITLNAPAASTSVSNTVGETSTTIIVPGFNDFSGNEITGFPFKIAPNLWVESLDDLLNGELLFGTRPATVTANRYSTNNGTYYCYVYVNGSIVKTISGNSNSQASVSATVDIPIGASCYIQTYCKYNCGTASLTFGSYNLHLNTL